MLNRFWWLIFFFVTILLLDRVVFAVDMTVFDFDDVPTSKKHHSNNYVAIESYMEALYGSEVTISQGTTAANNAGKSAADAFLTNGKGKNSAIVVSFASPINSFAIDWQVFKRGTGIIIKADGVIIYQDLLTKSEKKTGIMDHLDPFFFDQPVHTLEIIGVKNSKIGIDNLAVNIPSEYDSESAISTVGFSGTGGNNQNGDGYSGGSEVSPQDGVFPLQTDVSVPEPASLILLGFGLLAIGALGRRVRIVPAAERNNVPTR